ncbi:histidine kinase dimerization/phospho-acceptor domain-containing protein [Turicibacter sanguinis]
MSLRQKGAIVIFLIFILNFGTLVWYYNFYLSDQVLAEIEEAQQSVNATTFEILSKIQSNQSIDEYGSKSFHNGDCYQIVIENLEGETLYENKPTIKGSLGVHESSIFEYEGSYYLLKVTGILSVEDPFAISPVMTLLDFEQFNIVISIIILTTLLYLFIIKPIEGLKLDMDQYQKGIKPRKTNRCDEVGKLKNRFVYLANELEDQKLQQSRIIASISHDIKTPLTSIMGYAERLNKGNLSAERMKRYTETIYDKSMVIKELIDEFDHYLNYNL